MANRTIVVSLSSDAAEVAQYLLPTPRMHVRAADRLYYFYQSNADQQFAFDDMIEMHSFATLIEARAWVSADAHLRGAKGTVQ